MFTSERSTYYTANINQTNDHNGKTVEHPFSSKIRVCYFSQSYQILSLISCFLLYHFRDRSLGNMGMFIHIIIQTSQHFPSSVKYLVTLSLSETIHSHKFYKEPKLIKVLSLMFWMRKLYHYRYDYAF